MLSQHHERRRSASAGEEPVFHQHYLITSKKQRSASMTCRDEDLVRHGRNLPGYLEHGGKRANTKDKILKFGVLDWSRLEKWKSNTKRNNSLALESRSARISTTINSIPQSDQQASNGSQINLSCRERLPAGARPRGKAVKFQTSETVTWKTFDWEQNSCSKDFSSDSNEKQAEQMIMPERETSLGDNHPSSSHDHELRLSDSRKSRDVNSTGIHQRKLSDCFSADDLHPLNPSSEILHSCPFPPGANLDTEFPYEIPDAPLKHIFLKENKSAVELLLTDKDCTKIDLDIGEQPFVKERHSSLNRRFLFSLEKIAKSFSFKTSSAFPQVGSTYNFLKSGPVTFGSSPDLLDYNSKKGNATNIVRSIPMRRLLDPLMKQHSAKKVQQSNGNLVSNAQAFLKLKMNNGIPFFKLTVDNGSYILTAAVKKLPSGQDDSSLTYTFYSVHTINKKSGGWKNQEFGHNIVGEMKISSSYHAEFSGLERDLFVVRESVLYGPDFSKSDQITSDCISTSELAAIIIKNTSKEHYGGLGSSKSTVVILPGGTHSLPNSGHPSSLINRWKSGGVCDCGGWDIGCELQILTNQSESIEIQKPSTLDCLDLCYQGMHKKKHALSLALLENGFYSLECNSSISLLQAFSICVAVVSSQTLTHIFQVNHLQDANDFTKSVREKAKRRTIVHANIPPPVSPIGRV